MHAIFNGVEKNITNIFLHWVHIRIDTEKKDMPNIKEKKNISVKFI